MTVSELVPETSKSFKPPIDCFVSACNFLLCTLFTFATVVRRTPDRWVSLVSGVSFYHFSRKQHRLDVISIDSNVSPLPCFEGAMTRHYFSCLDTSADSVAKSSRFELVTVVTWIKGVRPPFWLTIKIGVSFVEDLEVDTIMVYLASFSFVIS